MIFKHASTLSALALLSIGATTSSASAEDDPYLGQMTMVVQAWCPRGYAAMNGQELAITSNQRLFALIGTTYGGDGISTFWLPDMRGRTPVGVGTSRYSGTNYVIGMTGGAETVTLSVANLPSHNHLINASDRSATSGDPSGRDFADFSGTALNGYASELTIPQVMANNTIGSAGSAAPFNIRQPYITINYCIATSGLWPERP